MSELELYSCYRFGEKRESRHQIKMFVVDEDEDVINYPYFYIIVNPKFILKLWKHTPIELIEEFLDYHYNKFSGAKEMWLRGTEEIICNEITTRKKGHLRNVQILKWIESKKKELTNAPKAPSKKSIFGFPLVQDHLNYNRTTPLCNLLKELGFIDCSPIIFKKLFTATFNPEEGKINWTGSQIELLYFMSILITKYKLIHEPNDLHKRITNSFQINGQEMNKNTASIRAAFAGLKTNRPRRAILLDKIFKDVFGVITK